MDSDSFEAFLDRLCNTLTKEAQQARFKSSSEFENRVRELSDSLLKNHGVEVDFNPHPQAFPDVALGIYGIEVKFTNSDTWRSVANSVLETNRIEAVTEVYIVFGKMGGSPEARWGRYEESVMHVRTSHVPRFEVEIGASESLFSLMSVAYDDFRALPMHEKMKHIRQYARERLRPGERLWWLGDAEDDEGHTLPAQARLYTKLPQDEKLRLRAEAVLLCPQIVNSGRSRDKYDDVVLYLMTYHGVVCHQARDLFSAGSVANPKNDNAGGIYIERALKLIEPNILEAAASMDDSLFEEYWGERVGKEKRIAEWLKRADSFAKDWKPSESLFLTNNSDDSST